MQAMATAVFREPATAGYISAFGQFVKRNRHATIVWLCTHYDTGACMVTGIAAACFLALPVKMQNLFAKFSFLFTQHIKIWQCLPPAQ